MRSYEEMRAENRNGKWISILCALVVWAQLERVIAEGIGWEVTEHSSCASCIGVIGSEKASGGLGAQRQRCLAWSPLSSPS